MDKEKVFRKLKEIADALGYEVVERRLRQKELIEQIKSRKTQPFFDDELESHYFFKAKEYYRENMGGWCNFESKIVYLNQFPDDGQYHSKEEVLAHELGHALMKEIGQHQGNNFIDETLAEVTGQFLQKICRKDFEGFVIRLPAMALVAEFLESKLRWPLVKLEMLKEELEKWKAKGELAI